MATPMELKELIQPNNHKINSTHEEVMNKQELHIKPSSKTDDALAYISAKQGITWELEEEKKVLRKIDMMLMPTVRDTDTFVRKRAYHLRSFSW